MLDALLRTLATQGKFVSAHPDTILRMGTKDVLLAVRHLEFGSDTHRIDSLRQMEIELPERLTGGARILKQVRGHSGMGIWRVEREHDGRCKVQQAVRSAAPESLAMDALLKRMAPYFAAGGHVIDQAWQPRMVEGMIRVYMVGTRVAGFGFQDIVALHPELDGGAGPPPSTRVYSDAGDSRFQDLRRHMEDGWVSALCESTGVSHDDLPVLWDADFFRADTAANDGFVLCEINMSSVSPFPASAIEQLIALCVRSAMSCR